MKRIGRFVAAPRSRDVKRSRKAATLVDESVNVSGAKLSVQVHHAYPSRLFGNEITVAGGRHVHLVESDVRVRIDDFMVTVEMVGRRQRRRPPYGGTAQDIPRRLLATFPILYEMDEKDRFTGVTIFRPRRGRR
jgi:hypothetical protein